MRSVGAFLVAILGAWSPGVAQETFADLLRSIARADDAARTRAIEAFVASRAPGDPDTLRARLLRAAVLLRGFALEAAAKEFRQILAALPRRERDLTARALYGLAQCEELRGRTRQCIDALQRLQHEFRDLRHARFAAASLRRLQNRDGLAIGRPVPEFTARDVTGRSHSSSSARGRPLLVAFFAPADAVAVLRVSRLLDAFRRGGGRDDDAMLFAVERDVLRLRAFARARAEDAEWSSPILACTGAFLDPVLLQFGVQALPDAFLIGPDGTLLLKSPTPEALRGALSVLLRK